MTISAWPTAAPSIQSPGVESAQFPLIGTAASAMQMVPARQVPELFGCALPAGGRAKVDEYASCQATTLKACVCCKLLPKPDLTFTLCSAKPGKTIKEAAI